MDSWTESMAAGAGVHGFIKYKPFNLRFTVKIRKTKGYL
jgi:hypothetical protein